MYTWEDDLYDGPRVTSSSYVDMTVNQVRDIWEDLGVGNSGYLDKLELATVCKNIGLQELEKEVSGVSLLETLSSQQAWPVKMVGIPQRLSVRLVFKPHRLDELIFTITFCGGLHLYTSLANTLC